MKAIRIHETGNSEVMRLEDVETPAPQANEVLIRVAVAGVNYADLMQRQGIYPLQLPAIPGTEVAGTIVAPGSEVKGWEAGTRVMAIVSGGYAEYSVANVKNVIPIPDNLGFPEASALLIQGLTAYQLLHDAAKVQPGETVLVHAAAGGVGSLAVQIARWLGASRVVGTASTERKMNFIRSLGADIAINYTQKDWIKQIKEVVGEVGIDVILDSVGGNIGEQSLNLLAPFGRQVIFGAASGQMTPLVGQNLIWKNQSVIGYTLNGQPSELLTKATENLLQAIATEKVRIHSLARFPLKEAGVAHQAIQQRQTIGKVVLLV